MSRWKKNRFARPAIKIEDVIHFISEYFFDLKRRLKFNRVVDRIDMELPRFIIRKFKELFEIWDNNLLLSKCLDKELFETVYNSMADIFETCPSDISDHSWSTCDSGYMECNECGEEITLRNNNRQYSVAYHNASRQHLEFIENFVKVRNERKTEPCEEDECSKFGDQIVPIPKADNVEDVATNSSEKCLKCDECNEEFVLKDDVEVEDALIEHKKSLLHWEQVREKETDTVEFVALVMNEQGVTVICRLCGVNFSVETSNTDQENNVDVVINAHTRTENHILNLYWFGLQRTHIRVYNEDERFVDERFVECTLCDEVFALDAFHDHFYAGSASQHGRRMLLSTINADNLRKSVAKLKINYITRLNANSGVCRKCHLCSVQIRPFNSDPDDEECARRSLDEAVSRHEESEDHILNLYWFELQNCYIRVIDVKENLIECTLCDEIFRLDSFRSHFYGAGSNSQHERRVLLASIHPASVKKAIDEMKIDCINQIENNAGTFMRCHICRVLMPTVMNGDQSSKSKKYLIDVVNLHQQGEDHLINLYWLQLQKSHVEVYDRKQNILRCTLCDLIFHVDSFYDHFYGGGSTNQHNRRSLFAAITNKRGNESTIIRHNIL